MGWSSEVDYTHSCIKEADRDDVFATEHNMCTELQVNTAAAIGYLGSPVVNWAGQFVPAGSLLGLNTSAECGSPATSGSLVVSPTDDCYAYNTLAQFHPLLTSMSFAVSAPHAHWP